MNLTEQRLTKWGEKYGFYVLDATESLGGEYGRREYYKLCRRADDKVGIPRPFLTANSKTRLTDILFHITKK